MCVSELHPLFASAHGKFSSSTNVQYKQQIIVQGVQGWFIIVKPMWFQMIKACFCMNSKRCKTVEATMAPVCNWNSPLHPFKSLFCWKLLGIMCISIGWVTISMSLLQTLWTYEPSKMLSLYVQPIWDACNIIWVITSREIQIFLKYMVTDLSDELL